MCASFPSVDPSVLSLPLNLSNLVAGVDGAGVCRTPPARSHRSGPCAACSPLNIDNASRIDRARSMVRADPRLIEEISEPDPRVHRFSARVFSVYLEV